MTIRCKAGASHKAQDSGKKAAAQPTIRTKEREVDDARRRLMQAETALAAEES